jgi:MFS family permease
LVSLFADMVYEGARSIIGPFLATLGATAAVVGAVAGAAEFIGYGLRVASGYLVRRRRNYWAWTITGYALTVLSVPLIGVTTVIAPALLLYGTERLGKAVRSPAKDTLLSHASTRTGRGSAFGVHQAMDQVGAMAGPLLLAAVLSQSAGSYRLAFGILVVPGVVVLALLLWLRLRVPDPAAYERAEPSSVERAEPSSYERGEPAVERAEPSSYERAEPAVERAEPVGGERADPAAYRGASMVSEAVQGRHHDGLRTGLPPLVRQYVGTVGLLSLGIASFPLLAFHAQTRGLLTPAQVPVLFAVAMAVDGVSGLLMGRFYDRLREKGAWVLLVVPVAAGVSAIAFTDSAALVWAGVAVWGLVHGVMDSTVKAVVTELVEPGLRSVAFGWLALARGLGLLTGGIALGVVYDHSIPAAIWLVLGVNVVALAALVWVLALWVDHKP